MGIFSFRGTKERVKKAAGEEVANFILAIDAWNADREDFEGLTQALQHFIVYDIRRADYMAGPRLSIPAERALLAYYWMENFRHVNLLDAEGRQCLWDEKAATFWSSVERLRNERDKLVLQNHFMV